MSGIRVSFSTTRVGLLATLLVAGVGASAQTVVFKDTFGSTTTRLPSSYVPQISGVGATSYYKFADPVGSATNRGTANSQRYLLDGYYAVVNPQNIRDTLPPPAYLDPATGLPDATLPTAAGGWWANGGLLSGDHTGDGGAVLAVNAGNTQNHMYRRLVTLTPGTTYEFSAWLYMVQAPGNTQLSLRQPDDSAPLGTSAPFPVQSTGDAALHQWVQRSWKFTTPPASCATPPVYAVAYSNLDPTGAGNDLFIDDVQLVTTADATGATAIPCSAPAQQPPTVTATPKSVTTGAGVPITIDVAAGNSSSDPTNAPLAAPHPDTSQTAVKPANGTVTWVNGQPQYTPNPGYTGTDQFSYEVCTVPMAPYNTAVCTTAIATVNVVGVNATGASGSTTPGTAVTIPVTYSSTDPANAPLGTPTTVSAPANGTVAWVNGQPVYTPNPGFTGPSDSFTYRVCVAGATPPICSADQTVTVAVAPAPVTVTASPGNGATQPGQPVTIPVTYSSSDPTNAPLGTPTTVTAPANGTVQWVNGQPVYTPNPGFQGPSDTFTYQVCTAAGVTPQVCSQPQTVSVAVAAAVAVPANATWALGLLSLGMLGFAARRMRRRQD